MLCSEILDLHLRRRIGPIRVRKTNFEAIWSSGALLRISGT